jgi:hypothetical protein
MIVFHTLVMKQGKRRRLKLLLTISRDQQVAIQITNKGSSISILELLIPNTPLKPSSTILNQEKIASLQLLRIAGLILVFIKLTNPYAPQM